MLRAGAVVGTVNECFRISNNPMEPLQMLAVGIEILNQMSVVFRQWLPVALKAIRIHNRPCFQILIDEFLDSRNLDVRGGKHLQITGTAFFVLSSGNRYALIPCFSAANTLDLRTKVGVIELNNPAKHIVGISGLHSLANPTQKIPGCLVAHGDSSGQSQSGMPRLSQATK